MSKFFVLTISVVVLLAMATVAFSQDAVTFQKWTFDTDSLAPAAAVVDNAFGTPKADIVVGDLGTGYYSSDPVYGTATGFWDFSGGSIKFTIPNREGGLYKDITVEVTYWKDITMGPSISAPGFSLVSTDYNEDNSEFGAIVERVKTGGVWYKSTWNLHIEPNPSVEVIICTPNPDWGSMVSEVSISTKCVAVPEPGTLAALGGGLLSLAGFAIRRKRA